jgi:hypothetical protein
VEFPYLFVCGQDCKVLHSLRPVASGQPIASSRAQYKHQKKGKKTHATRLGTTRLEMNHEFSQSSAESGIAAATLPINKLAWDRRSACQRFSSIASPELFHQEAVPERIHEIAYTNSSKAFTPVIPTLMTVAGVRESERPCQ